MIWFGERIGVRLRALHHASPYRLRVAGHDLSGLRLRIFNIIKHQKGDLRSSTERRRSCLSSLMERSR